MNNAKPALLLALAAFAQPPSPFLFEDIAPRSGVQFILRNAASPRKYQIETMISGLALFDCDGDGLLDIYFVNGAPIPALEKNGPSWFNRLYRNNGDGTFTDRTLAAGLAGRGYGMGAAAADFDNDGDQDLFLAGVNHNQLFRNNGDGTFTDVTARAGLAGIHPVYGKMWSVSAGWADLDNDGLLDLFVTNYVRWSPAAEKDCLVNKIRTYCAPGLYEGLPNSLYRNNGDGTFTDISAPSGIAAHIGKGMGLAFGDIDADGDTDIFVANDTVRNFLFRNDGINRFTETAILAGVAFNGDGRSIAGMGADLRDYDNDGRPDIFVTATVNDTFPLYRNTGGPFDDVTYASGVGRATARRTGWGNGIFDFDNDGRKDLFAALGAILDNSMDVEHLPARLPNLLLRNEGSAFREVKALPTERIHRGAAFGDLDNDGRIDVVTVSLNEAPEIWMNRSPGGNHWLLFHLRGTRANRDGLGARIALTTPSGLTLHNHATTAVGMSAASDRRVHFGLGRENSAAKVEVLWPGGRRQVLENVPANRIVTLLEP